MTSKESRKLFSNSIKSEDQANLSVILEEKNSVFVGLNKLCNTNYVKLKSES